MRAKNRFTPAPVGGLELESRALLSGGFRPAAALTRTTPAAVLRTRPASVADRIDLAFDTFRQEYSQARSLYFGSITGTSSPTVTKESFDSYTTQRVNALAQELLAAMRVPTGSHKSGNTGSGTASVIARRINGRVTVTTPANVQTTVPAGGTLLRALIDNIPAVTPAPTAQSTTFYTLAQNSAIDAAEGSLINALGYYRLQQSGKKGR